MESVPFSLGQTGKIVAVVVLSGSRGGNHYPQFANIFSDVACSSGSIGVVRMKADGNEA